MRVPPSVPGSTDAPTSIPSEDWIGPTPPDQDEASGLELLLRRHLSGFGPAPLRDVANWAGVPVGALLAVADRLAVRRFRDESGTEILDVADGPLPGAGARAPVRFLGTWDAVLLAHARRTCVLREEHRPLPFSNKSPQSTPCFLVDGQVVGTW